MTANMSGEPTSRGGSAGREHGIFQVRALREIVDGGEAIEVHRAGHLVQIHARSSANCLSRKRVMSSGRSREVSRRTAAP